VTCTVDIPVLQDLASAFSVGGAGIAMAAGYLPTMQFLLRPDRSDSLFDDLGAIVGMHGGVAVAVENNGWDRRSARN
jgi:hypothetical protein